MQQSQEQHAPCDCSLSAALSTELKNKNHAIKRLQRDLKAAKKRIHTLKVQKTKLLEKLSAKKPKSTFETGQRFFSISSKLPKKPL